MNKNRNGIEDSIRWLFTAMTENFNNENAEQTKNNNYFVNIV